MVDFGRVEYQTRVGWVIGHAGIALTDPEKYVSKMMETRGIVARFVPLDDAHRPRQPVYPKDFTGGPFHEAQQSKVIPIQRISECAACSEPHQRPWECIL